MEKFQRMKNLNEEAGHQEIKNLYMIKSKESNLILKNLKSDEFVEEDSFNFKFWKTKEKAKEALSKYLSNYPDFKRKLFVYKVEFGLDEEEIDVLKKGYKEQQKTDEMILFKKLNKMCLDCERDCKESSKTTIIQCFKTMNESDKRKKRNIKKNGE